jgi:2-aminophenol/2-amino-5-chlorophenol 1,6-dioxygenase subunit alpha
MTIPLGCIVSGMPQPLLAPEKNKGWQALRDSYGKLRQQLIEQNVDTILLYSTQWFSILGHQLQGDPYPEWEHVDQEFHELGSMKYSFETDVELAELYNEQARKRGLHCRLVSYKGFPVDTGSIVAIKLLNPDNRFKVGIISCNMYADRAETVVLGKAAADAITASGRRVAPIAVTCLSNRFHTEDVLPKDDHIASLMDDEWNQKLLELLAIGRLEDVAQLARTFASQAHADNKLKAIWWLSAVMGQHNRYTGNVLEYQPVFGTGSTVVSLIPAGQEVGGHEFDEDDVDFYSGDREVLAIKPQNTEESPKNSDISVPQTKTQSQNTIVKTTGSENKIVKTSRAPKPVGAYPHSRRVGDLLFLSGVGPRQPETDAVPGGPIHDKNGVAQNYDIEAQTRAVIENIKIILEDSGSSLDRIVDVQAFLIDMDRDFKGYNKIYAEYFTEIQATRTTIAIRALPTPIAVEFKVIALAGDVPKS